ncbi:uncharacterized protein KY384_003310 [Bacidia gigantensis]|uniref:uncharacterized protein n=1 Tax=Bacidia gigantensis TaxID=2732470 RepID=UPI001D052921|nr:uncharacterized protein KY384_003310 [Bacidia gigantensis]KAG8531678.1 hypothetical protein KY384_003310 [Bacidia gigantensis]
MSVGGSSNNESLPHGISDRDGLSAGSSSGTSSIYLEPASRSVLPSLKKRFTRPWARRDIDNDDEKAGRGPLGLRLLHSSPEALMDIILVHGLRGGSVKTWRKGKNPRTFWPQYWLPLEPELHNANIHSFGYDSDWANTKSSILNIHDFGQSLLEEMRNSPSLRDKENVKSGMPSKAFVLANDIPEFQRRIQCVFFLATPHRGSDYAEVLNNILLVSGIMSSRHYITDITTGSLSAQLINEEFEKAASDLRIFSFYETLPMKIGLSSKLIVEKRSAILGTASIVQESRGQMKVLRSFLGITDHPNEDYHRVEGSCQWIEAREDFQHWMDPTGQLVRCQNSMSGKNPCMFWVTANPGTGKTYLAAHVIDRLAQLQLAYSYYYFHVGSKSSRSPSHFLRSTAYQMAKSNALVREKLMGICEEGSIFDNEDATTIWTKVFRKGIFQVNIRTPQYWVIDAIDECARYRELFTLLRGIQLKFPLKIFLTSRKIPELHSIQRSLESWMSISYFDIPAEDSAKDIDCYIQQRVHSLGSQMVNGKENVGETLLRRSDACFLWVRLVLDELEKVYVPESFTQILNSIPRGMVPFYKRTVSAMANNTVEKSIARAVLAWVVASSRDLSLPELSSALKLDINTVLPCAKTAVEGLCGQLVVVDHHSDFVRLVHATTREFLFSEDAGEFYISQPEAHERIALTCLKLLSSSEMKPPRNQKTSFLARENRDPSPLMDYSITQFSEHICSALAKTDEILLALSLFFKTNILSWIERVAQMDDLYPLIRVSKNLKSYLDWRARYLPPLSSEVQIVDSWSTDLSRIATNFGSALLQDPWSIHFVIPPFCPLDSAIYKQFARRPGPLALSVVGHKENTWDDCVAFVNFGEDSVAAAVSCGENLIAVGLESGDINVFNRKSCQKEGVFHQTHPIDLIHFTDRSIVACTTRSVVLMDRMGNPIWQNRLRFRCILLTSSPDAIVAVSQHGHVLKWDISTGALLDDQAFMYTSPESDGGGEPAPKAPDVVSLSADLEMLAIAYRWGTVCIFEVETAEVIAWPRDEYNRLAAILLFNPNPNISLLLIVYTDHRLALFEPETGFLVSAQDAPSAAGILSASCSPDGKTLATANKLGVLQIWDFESLGLLYHVSSPATPSRIIHFVSDGSSVIDVIDSGMRIWNPAALARKKINEDQSISDDAYYLVATEGEYETRRIAKITALCAHPTSPFILAGKHNGQVIAFDTKTGLQIQMLYNHPDGATISGLAVSHSDILASSDVNCGVQVWKLKQALSPAHLYTYSSATLKGAIKQLCFNGDYLLVATTHSDQVYSMEDGSCVGTLQFELGERKVWRWLQVPSQSEQPTQFALIQGHLMTRFSASDFPSKIDNFKADLEYDIGEGNNETDINSAVIHPETQNLILDIQYASGYVSSSSMFFFNLSKMTTMSELIPKYCKHFIGVSERTQTFVFLHQNSWLCSISKNQLALGQYTQHFYVPDKFMLLRHRVLPTLTADDDVVFCLYDELTVVRNGLIFKETKVLS